MTSHAHLAEDRLVDLALGEVDQAERDMMTAHLARCEGCRADYAAISDNVDHVLAATPPAAPPPGFSQSVLRTMGIAPREIDGPTPAHTPNGTPPDPAARPRHVDRAAVGPRARRAALALVAAAALIVGAAGAALVLQTRIESPAPVAAGPPIVSSDGIIVGTVLESRYDDEPVLIVTVNGGRVGARYECQLVLTDGTRQTAGSWTLTDDTGATWVVHHPTQEVKHMNLVTDEGHTWATADL